MCVRYSPLDARVISPPSMHGFLSCRQVVGTMGRLLLFVTLLLLVALGNGRRIGAGQGSLKATEDDGDSSCEAGSKQSLMIERVVPKCVRRQMSLVSKGARRLIYKNETTQHHQNETIHNTTQWNAKTQENKNITQQKTRHNAIPTILQQNQYKTKNLQNRQTTTRVVSCRVVSSIYS
mgnify:CR=1 FL=1